VLLRSRLCCLCQHTHHCRESDEAAAIAALGALQPRTRRRTAAAAAATTAGATANAVPPSSEGALVADPIASGAYALQLVIPPGWTACKQCHALESAAAAGSDGRGDAGGGDGRSGGAAAVVVCRHMPLDALSLRELRSEVRRLAHERSFLMEQIR
jgi:hypothetical protein